MLSAPELLTFPLEQSQQGLATDLWAAVQAAEDRWQQQEAQLRAEVALLEESVRRLEGANADLQTASSEHMQPLQRCALCMLRITSAGSRTRGQRADTSCSVCGYGSIAQPLP